MGKADFQDYYKTVNILDRESVNTSPGWDRHSVNEYYSLTPGREGWLVYSLPKLKAHTKYCFKMRGEQYLWWKYGDANVIYRFYRDGHDTAHVVKFGGNQAKMEGSVGCVTVGDVNLGDAGLSVSRDSSKPDDNTLIARHLDLYQYVPTTIGPAY